MRDEKEERRKKKERRKRKKNKIEIFAFNFFDCEEKSWDSGLHLTLEQLRVFIFKSFASLHCVCLGAAPIP